MAKQYNLLITGGAGFIGSNLVEYFLNDERVSLVRVLDDLSNGYYENIEEFEGNPRFEFIKGDICDYETCLKATKGIDKISHQAALGSVPRSIENPMRSTEVNILGTVNVLHAAVIPIFCQAFMEEKSPTINGDGHTSRDFTYVANAVQANDKALFTESIEALNEIYNVACNERVSLNEMVETLCEISGFDIEPNYGPERPGDVKHSEADISKIQNLMGYEPEVRFDEGLELVYKWYAGKYTFK